MSMLGQVEQTEATDDTTRFTHLYGVPKRHAACAHTYRSGRRSGDETANVRRAGILIRIALNSALGVIGCPPLKGAHP